MRSASLMWLFGCAACGVIALCTAQASPHAALAPPAITQPVVDRARRAALVQEIERMRSRQTRRALTKDDVRPLMKLLVPLLNDCFVPLQRRDPRMQGGVFNLRLAIDSEPQLGTVLTARGFDASGPLAGSTELKACATTLINAVVLPPVAAGGSIEILYPVTLASQPPDNKSTAMVDQARQAAAGGRWTEALSAAERGLEVTSIDGTLRRPLIEIAGVAACHLQLQAKARHYAALSSAAVERRVRSACASAGTAL